MAESIFGRNGGSMPSSRLSSVRCCLSLAPRRFETRKLALHRLQPPETQLDLGQLQPLTVPASDGVQNLPPAMLKLESLWNSVATLRPAKTISELRPRCV
jgi:hypothetical protein